MINGSADDVSPSLLQVTPQCRQDGAQVAVQNLTIFRQAVSRLTRPAIYMSACMYVRRHVRSPYVRVCTYVRMYVGTWVCK